MFFSIENIRNDLHLLSEHSFYEKYIIKSKNWYFEKYLDKNDIETSELLDEYRLITSRAFNVNFYSTIMVGSGKIGYSLAPHTQNIQPKLFEPFCHDGKSRKESDIDIAIISPELYHFYWDIFRKSYKPKFEATYRKIYVGLYRGYIDERNIIFVDGSRLEWEKKAKNARNKLSTDLYIKHKISFRIYRNWNDFYDYNIQNIKKIKKDEYAEI